MTKTFGLLSSVFVAFSATMAVAQRAASSGPGQVITLSSVNALPPHIVGRLRDPVGCAKIPDGPYYLFDRRGHSVHTVQGDGSEFRTLVEIGGEEGRLLEPSAFDVANDGSFAVADAPAGELSPVFPVHAVSDSKSAATVPTSSPCSIGPSARGWIVAALISHHPSDASRTV